MSQHSLEETVVVVVVVVVAPEEDTAEEDDPNNDALGLVDEAMGDGSLRQETPNRVEE